MNTRYFRITVVTVSSHVPRAIFDFLSAVDMDVTGSSSSHLECDGDLTDDQFILLCGALHRAECVRSFTVHSVPQ